MEPVTIARGRIPLRLAVEMINAHRDDCQANSAPILADKYKLDLQTTYHILEYFQPFNLRLPQAEDVAGSTVPMLQERNLKQTQKRLASAQKIIDDYSNRSKT